MKKMFVVLAAGALAGCTTWQNMFPRQPEREEQAPRPRFVTETPYGLSHLFEETSAPQMYSVIAARVTNKMLDQTTEIYEKPMPPKLYVMQIKKAGVAMAFVPEDRLGMGLVGSMGMGSNMMLRSWRKGKGAFVNRRDPNKLAMEVMEELEVVTPSISTPVRRLSGGNVQKVLVGRELAASPIVLMTAYAVRGLDINASYTIYDLINRQKERGVAVIYVGEDLDVLLELADRILVLCGGKVSGIGDARTATKEEIGLMMTRVGGGKEEAVHA